MTMRRALLVGLTIAFVTALGCQVLAPEVLAGPARASLTLAPGASEVHPGAKVAMAGELRVGALAPSTRRVRIQILTGGQWHKVAWARIHWLQARSGMYSVKVELRRVGNLRFRAAWTAGTASVVSPSSVVKVVAADVPLPTPSPGIPGAPGPQPNGTAVTPNGWTVTPAGTQTALGTGALALALSPDGKRALVVEGGFYNGEVRYVDTSSGRILQTEWPHTGGKYSLYAGAAFSADGARAYVSDGPQSDILVYYVMTGRIRQMSSIRLPDWSGKYPVYPAGIALAKTSPRLFVAANLRGTLDIVNLKDTRQSQTKVVPVGHRPYAVVLSRDEKHAYVSNWGGETVTVVDTATAKVEETIPVGTHPSAMVLNPVNNELYVANSDSDTVSVVDTATQKVLRIIDMAPYDGARIGASPNALTVSPDGHTLYVANAGDNDIAVVALSVGGASMDTTKGLIPTACYPCGVALSPAADKLYVMNMKGKGVGPMDWAPWRIQPLPVWPFEFILRETAGSLETIPVPAAGQLAAYTALVQANDKFGEEPGGDGTVIPTGVAGGTASPIKHIIYIIKENRSYDQVLGDLGRGNGDPGLVDFGYSVTPNQHRLAKQFVTLDNYYADGEVSMDGWSWANAANCNTYTEKNVPLIYGSMFDLVQGWGITSMRRPDDEPGFGQAEFPNATAAIPGPDVKHAYFWDTLAAADISFEDFGFFIGEAPEKAENLPTSMPDLQGHTDLNYPGWDLSVSDQQRYLLWKTQFDAYEKAGEMPTVQFIYLPRDHTWTLQPGKLAPASMVADNDYALGKIVDRVSHSKFWEDTAIFVTEDDAQDGADHVDGHRTVAQIISPYTQTGAVDSTFYSTVSVLHTMELILGISPMTQFDATATPMYRSFTPTPVKEPYSVVKPDQSMTVRNPTHGPMAAICAKLDFSHPDAVSPVIAAKACWLSVHGSLDGWPPKGAAQTGAYVESGSAGDD